MLTGHTYIDQNPEDQTGSEFIEGFDVEGANGWIELAADEKLERHKKLDHSEERANYIVDEAAGISTQCKQFTAAKRHSVDEYSLGKGHQN